MEDLRLLRTNVLIVTSLLLAIGIVMVYSASCIYAYEHCGDTMYFLKRHIFYILVGIIISFYVLYFDYRRLQKYSKHILFCCFIALILVLLPSIGKKVLNAKRWIQVFGFTIQPSEITKLAMILYLADFFSRKKFHAKNFMQGFVPPVLATGFFALLILLEPDMGTAMVICMICFIMMFIAGASVKYLFFSGLASLPVLYLLVFSVPYRRNRMFAFLDPWADPKGIGYQLIQSFLALGKGGLFGVGLGNSAQKLFYLPQSYSDFIFAIIGEELGFIGTFFILVLFMLLIWLGVEIIFKTADYFGKLIALGIVSMIALEVVINVGVNSGMFPPKGLPLPFISYGGTSLIVHIVAIALLLNISKKGTTQGSQFTATPA